VLVLCRVAGMMVFAPLLGSVRIPKTVKSMIAVVLAIALAPVVAPPVRWPDTDWQLAVGMGGELCFGLAIGMAMSFVFIAVQAGGEIIGQQMGINLGSTFDPTFGGGGSVISDLYFMMTLTIFLAVNGHHALLIGVKQSFVALPLLTLGIDRPLLALTVQLLHACTLLAFQLAAPILVTMLVLDLSLGFISKTVPQLNVMTAGMSIRGLVAMLVLIVGLVLTSEVIRNAVLDSMWVAYQSWTKGI
jgi:flagellar biosynthetic protein FliR